MQKPDADCATILLCFLFPAEMQIREEITRTHNAKNPIFSPGPQWMQNEAHILLLEISLKFDSAKHQPWRLQALEIHMNHVQACVFDLCAALAKKRKETGKKNQWTLKKEKLLWNQVWFAVPHNFFSYETEMLVSEQMYDEWKCQRIAGQGTFWERKTHLKR